MSPCISVKVFHGGKFDVLNGELVYVEGKITTFKDFDLDYMSWFQVEDAVKSCGFVGELGRVWYKLPFEPLSARKPLWYDVDENIRSLCADAKLYEEVELYVEEGSQSQRPPCCGDFGSATILEVGDDESNGASNQWDDENLDVVYKDDVDESEDDVSDAHWNPGGSESDDVDCYDNDDDHIPVKILGDNEFNVDVAADEGSRNGVNYGKACEGEDENMGDEVYPETPEATDSEWENFDKKKTSKQRATKIGQCDVHLSLGQELNSRFEFRKKLLHYVLATDYDIKLSCSCSVNMEAVCARKECNWRIYCSLEARSQKWTVKVFQEEHICEMSGRSKFLKIPDIAEMFLERIQKNPTFKAAEMRDEIKREFNLNVPQNMCSKAKRRALDIVRGDYGSQFAKLWDYVYELTRSNPGTTVDLQSVPNEDGSLSFSRLYICFASLKNAWKQHCRPVIGLDGCFLKWTMKGEILSAIGRDANNLMFPIAWAVVPVENVENWAWFVSKLKSDLDLKDGQGFTLISDEQKGLVQVISNVLPNIEHRMCARHIYANLRKKHKDRKLKPLFWQVARSYNKNAYLDNLKLFQTLSEDAYRSLIGSQANTWCRAFFNTTSCCHDEHNNLSEAFNSTIRDARTKPIIHMLEDIRRQAMQRIVRRTKASIKEKKVITPAASAHVDKAREDAKVCVMWTSTDGVFEIDDRGSAYKVSLKEKTCACREWDVTGLPCRHAMCAIIENRLDVSDFVPHYFLTRTWQATYASYPLHAVNGEKMWIKLGIKQMNGPSSRKMPGRPKKRDRVKEPHESPSKKGRISRHGRVIRCSICGMPGHNKATCKHRGTPDEGQIVRATKKSRGESSIKRKGKNKRTDVDNAPLMSSAPTQRRQKKKLSKGKEGQP